MLNLINAKCCASHWNPPIMIKVSVVMATYNHASTLPRAIDSILAQTLKDFEFIIVNDGSTDDTAKILEKYVQQDRRIKIMPQNNQGLAISRNNGVAKATGKYIAFMDSDDACGVNRLEVQYNFLEENSQFSACSLSYVSDIHEYTPEIKSSSITSYNSHIYENSPFNVSYNFSNLGPDSMINRDSFIEVGGYRAQNTIIEDLDFTLRYSHHNKWAALEVDNCYFYNQPAHSLNIGLVNTDILTFVKRHVASFISEWCRFNNMPDPVEEGKSLQEILVMSKNIPYRDRVIIYRSMRYLRYNIIVLTGMKSQDARNYLIGLIGNNFFERCYLRILFKILL